MEHGLVETPCSDADAFPAGAGATGLAATQDAVIYTIDHAYRITSVNAAWDAFAEANGAPHLRSSAILGTNLFTWISDPVRDEMRQICDALLAGEMQRYDYHFDCSSADERRVFAMTMMPLRDAGGAITGVQFVSRNLMEHAGENEQRDALAGLADHLRRQQTALDRAREEVDQHARAAMEQTARLHAALGGMADGVWICNQAGVLISVNDAGLEMFGLQRSEVAGQPLAVLTRLFRIGRGECRRLGLGLALQGETIHAECDVSLRSNTDDLTVDIRAAPIRDEGEGIIGAVAVVRNITDAKNTDRLKDEFLSVAAHELKTPITALKGYTQLAIKRTPPVPETQYTRRALETIDEQAGRITRLVQKLLDVSRIQSGRLELQPVRFDLQKLMACVVEQAQMIAPSHTIILTPHAPIMVTADYARLEQVLRNLVDNAIKYSSKDGTIRLVSELLAGQVRVSVQDHGVGIPENKLPHIFDRWYQAHWDTRGDYGGMGLGLYICREIIEQHGGHMWATSSAAEGTAIGFVLPLAAE